MLSNSHDGDNILSALFAREGASWAEVEVTLTKILSDDSHPNAGDLRRLLADHGYARYEGLSGGKLVHGMSLADAMPEAERRLERLNDERVARALLEQNGAR